MLDGQENIIHGLIFLMLGFLYDMTFSTAKCKVENCLPPFQTKTEGLSEN